MDYFSWQLLSTNLKWIYLNKKSPGTSLSFFFLFESFYVLKCYLIFMFQVILLPLYFIFSSFLTSKIK